MIKSGSSDTTRTGIAEAVRPSRSARGLGLVIAACRDEPHRAGELALVAGSEVHVLGRGPTQAADGGPRLKFVRDRPTRHGRTSRSQAGWLASERLSREQIRVQADGGALRLERTGRLAMTVADEPLDQAVLRPGQAVALGDDLLLLVVERDLDPQPLAYLGDTDWTFDFGAADPHGLVGESPAAWAVRDRIAFVARRAMHVLLEGESGVGKEIAARAIHALSSRASHPLVSRNAATLPASLIDAELFGHARNYPQGGMPERAGLVGEADGGTLFLDEIAELSSELQAHLLRLLDDGEYQRLGEATVRKSDLRVIAATNRMREALKHDFAARLKVSIHVPGLGERLEDIPLLARHLVLRMAKGDAEVRRFVREGSGAATPAIDPRFMDKLLRHRWTLHVRELEALFWTSIASSRGDILLATDEVEARLDLTPTEAGPGVEPTSLTAERVREALRAAGGNQSRAFRDLGLRSRDQLYRLMKKLGVRASDE